MLDQQRKVPLLPSSARHLLGGTPRVVFFRKSTALRASLSRTVPPTKRSQCSRYVRPFNTLPAAGCRNDGPGQRPGALQFRATSRGSCRGWCPLGKSTWRTMDGGIPVTWWTRGASLGISVDLAPIGAFSTALCTSTVAPCSAPFKPLGTAPILPTLKKVRYLYKFVI